MKVLLWLVIAFAVFWLLRNKKPKSDMPPAQSQGGTIPDPKPAEPMLQCHQCGIYVPSSDVVRGADGEAYCCDAHSVSHTHV